MNRFAVLALAAGALSASGACAADVTGTESPAVTLDVGIGGLVAPTFEGASDVTVIPIPYVSFDYKDIVFASVQDGLGVNVINTHGFKAGPVLNFAFPRNRSDDSSALRGLHDIDAGLQLGGFASYSVAEWLSFGVEARETIAGISFDEGGRTPKGLVAQAAATVSAPPLAGEKLFLSASPSITYYDEDYARTYFGISEGESLSSGYKAYRPDGGIGKAGIAIIGVYEITEKVAFSAFGQYERLLGDVADSPLVRGSGGSPDQFAAGASLSYRFKLL